MKYAVLIYPKIGNANNPVAAICELSETVDAANYERDAWNIENEPMFFSARVVPAYSMGTASEVLEHYVREATNAH